MPDHECDLLEFPFILRFAIDTILSPDRALVMAIDLRIGTIQLLTPIRASALQAQISTTAPVRGSVDLFKTDVKRFVPLLPSRQ